MRKFALLSLIPLMQVAPDLAYADNSAAASAFQGAYAGLELGAAAADGMTDFPVLSGGTRNTSFDPDTGRSFGVALGYDMQRGDMIYGAEVRYSNLSHVVEKGNPETREVMDFADLRGRVGYVNGDFMFYGALGWSWSRLRVHPSAQFDRDSQTTLDGFNIGLGMEYNFNDRWSLGADYTYRDVSGEFDDAPNDSDFDLSTLTARVAYRF